MRLTALTDADGRVSTLSYTNTNPSLITGVTDPFGHFAALRYDGSGRLTNITDAASLSSPVQYDTQNWITNLATWDGTTTFQHLDNGFITTNSDGSDYTGVIRAIRIIDPAGGTNIYMLRQNSVFSYFADTFPAPYLGGTFSTTTSPMACIGSNTVTVSTVGPLQAAGLASDMNTYTNTDCIKARMRHWLHATTNCTGSGEGFISQALNVIEPSPDGSILGQCNWVQLRRYAVRLSRRHEFAAVPAQPERDELAHVDHDPAGLTAPPQATPPVTTSSRSTA